MMAKAIQAWKQDFEAAHFLNQEAYMTVRAEGTRKSNNKTNNILNGAWKVYLAKTYGRHQDRLSENSIVIIIIIIVMLLCRRGSIAACDAFVGVITYR